MDPSASTEKDIEDGKYDPSILQNTLHKHLLGIVDKIEPQKKHVFLNIISDSLNSILSCFKCKRPLKENSTVFNCGHKYCDECTITLKKCTNCFDGNIPSNIGDFSNIFNVINEIKSNFNSDKVIYEMIRYLLMPQKFPHVEEVAETVETNVECTPSDSSAVSNVTARKSRKSTYTTRKSNASASASKNSRKKLEFNKESNETKNDKNSSNLENNSDCLFLATAKKNEKKRSYLELQPTISEVNKTSSPCSNTRSKRKSNGSYLELQPTVSEVIKVTTPVSNSNRKRKTSHIESVDQDLSKSKRLKTNDNLEDSLIEDEIKSKRRSLRINTSKQKPESPQRSSDSPNKGEEKQEDVTGTKVNPLLNSNKNTVHDVKNTFASERDMDTEVLDLDIWKCNVRYEKKKNLFKSVKERNKRSISIGGSLKNLLEHRNPSPKKQSPTKSDSKAEQIDVKNDSEMNISKNGCGTKKESTLGTPAKKTVSKNVQVSLVTSTEEKVSKNGRASLVTPTKGKVSQNGQVSEELISKNFSTSNPEPEKSTGMLLRKTVPKKKSPFKTVSSAVDSIVEKNDFRIILPTVTLSPDGKFYSICSPKKKISKTEKVLEFEEEASKTKIDQIDQLEKESAEISRQVESPLVKDSEPVVIAKEKATIEEPIIAKQPPAIPREILSEITDLQQNSIKLEKPKTSQFKTPGKLGLPLFPETNVDIFSQKGELCSSTPCGITMKKVTKTYSKAKNNLFNKSVSDFSPIVEGRNRFDELTFPDISPIAEKEQRNDQFQEVDLFDELIRKPKGVKNCSKSPNKKSPKKMATVNTQIVVAEVHEVPTTSPVCLAAVEKPQVDFPEEPKVPAEPAVLKTTLAKNLQLNEITHMEIDSPMKAITPAKKPPLGENIPMEIDVCVDKVAKNLLSKEMELTSDLEDEIQSVDSDVERKTKLVKLKKLQESINNKTEKTLSILKKNFNKNTSKLSVEKIKNSPISTISARNNSHFTPIKSSPPKDHDKKETTMISTPPSKELPNYGGDTPTQKRGTPTKSVACQTSPDLHLALFKQDFPQFFEKFTTDPTKNDLSLSVYDTPTEMTNEGVKITAKTPDVRLLNTTAKFTMVSSITSSEKKLADEQFMNESVLGNSSFFASANKTVNISGYAPLSPQTQGKKKLSCRLNFDGDDEVLKEKVVEPPESSASLNEDIASKNAPDSSIDRSKEIDFNDDELQGIEDEVLVSASILENSNLKIFPMVANKSKVQEDMNKTFFESDRTITPVSSATKLKKEDKDSSLIVIPDTDNGIPENDDKKEVVTDEDDDDVDFIAGTPTSQRKRILADTLEKIRTPLGLLRKPLDITLTEFSIVGNKTPNTNSVQPVPDVSQYSAVKKPTAAEITPIDEPAKKREVEKVSLELFNSSASFLSSASEKIFIATSGLREQETKIIKTFCQTFSAMYEDKLTEKSTHLVVKTNHKNRTARTFKYLQAIVSRVRIVSMKWIQECLAHEKIVDEENYIPLDSSGECGPLRTFHVIKDITPSPLSWLNEYCFYFTEPVPQECTLQQLQSIMQKAGGIVISNMREFKNYPKLHHIIIVSDDDDYDDEYNMKIAGWLETYEAVSVEFNWILEVIGRNRLMPFADFEVIEIPNEYLLQRNFPSVMLQSTEEDQNSSD